MTNTTQNKEIVAGLRFLPHYGKLSSGNYGSHFPSMNAKMHFKIFLSPNEHSPLVARALLILFIVAGCTLVLPPTSSLPNLYFEKMGEGRYQECRLKSSEYEPKVPSPYDQHDKNKEIVAGPLFTPRWKNWVRGILPRTFLGWTPEDLKLGPFHSLKCIFNGFLLRSSVCHSLEEH